MNKIFIVTATDNHSSIKYIIWSDNSEKAISKVKKRYPLRAVQIIDNSRSEASSIYMNWEYFAKELPATDWEKEEENWNLYISYKHCKNTRKCGCYTLSKDNPQLFTFGCTHT